MRITATANNNKTDVSNNSNSLITEREIFLLQFILLKL